MLAATTRQSYRLARMAAAGGVGLIGVDAAVLAAVALLPLAFTWPLAVATAASLTRLVLTARAMPRLFAG